MVFTTDEVESLNVYQKSGMFHPFTCGGDRTDENHLDGEGLLVATEEGWYCPFCEFRQSWAHEFMKDWSWKKHALEMRGLGRFDDDYN
jgi:hypothetical protein